MASVEVIGVFDGNGNQLFADAEAVRAIVTPKAKLMTHPLDTGATIADHIVFEPVEIELSVILKPATLQDTYQQVMAAYTAKTTITIVTSVDSYDSMVMVSPPYDQVPDTFNTVAMGLKFTEAQFVQAQFAQLPASWVKKPSNASTVKTGQKNPTPATQQQTNSTALSIQQALGF